jgi:hypothetical protein
MPYEKCVRYFGRRFCWNSETEQIEEIIIKPTNIHDCPEDVVLNLLKMNMTSSLTGKAGVEARKTCSGTPRRRDLEKGS